jgi:hypothetical protein
MDWSNRGVTRLLLRLKLTLTAFTGSLKLQDGLGKVNQSVRTLDPERKRQKSVKIWFPNRRGLRPKYPVPDFETSKQTRRHGRFRLARIAFLDNDTQFGSFNPLKRASCRRSPRFPLMRTITLAARDSKLTLMVLCAGTPYSCLSVCVYACCTRGPILRPRTTEVRDHPYILRCTG